MHLDPYATLALVVGSYMSSIDERPKYSTNTTSLLGDQKESRQADQIEM